MPKVSKTGGRKSSHICEYCDKEWPNSSKLEIHRRVHTGDRPFSCNLCSYATQKSSLQVHIRCHLKEKLHKCPETLCNYSTVISGNLKRHELVHTQEKQFSCPFPLCSYKTEMKSNLTAHLKTHEPVRDKPFQCELCPFKTTTSYQIKRHMTHVHSTERKFKCAEEGCAYDGKTRKDLNQHAQIHKDKRLSCPHVNCGYRTNLKNGLKSHLNIHSQEKRHKCRICAYASHYSSSLTVHMRTHTKESPYKCQIPGCSYAAKATNRLKKHVAGFHKNTPL